MKLTIEIEVFDRFTFPRVTSSVKINCNEVWKYKERYKEILMELEKIVKQLKLEKGGKKK